MPVVERTQMCEIGELTREKDPYESTRIVKEFAMRPYEYDTLLTLRNLFEAYS